MKLSKGFLSAYKKHGKHFNCPQNFYNRYRLGKGQSIRSIEHATAEELQEICYQLVWVTRGLEHNKNSSDLFRDFVREGESSGR